MRLTKTLPLLAVLGTLALPGAARAVSFSQADPDGNGYVTWEEAKRVFPRLKKVHFDKNDRKGDGRLDQGEFTQLNNFYWLLYGQAN